MGPSTLTFLCLSYALLKLVDGAYNLSDIRWIDSYKTEWYNPDDVLTIEAEIETQFFFADESWIAIHIQQCAGIEWKAAIGQGPDWGPTLEVMWWNSYSGEGNYKFASADVDANLFDHGQSYLWKIIAARADDSSLVFNVSLNDIQYISFTYIDGVSNTWDGVALPDDRPHILQISRDRHFGPVSVEEENTATTIRWFNVSGAPVISPRDYSCEYVYVESTTTTKSASSTLAGERYSGSDDDNDGVKDMIIAILTSLTLCMAFFVCFAIYKYHKAFVASRNINEEEIEIRANAHQQEIQLVQPLPSPPGAIAISEDLRVSESPKAESDTRRLSEGPRPIAAAEGFGHTGTRSEDAVQVEGAGNVVAVAQQVSICFNMNAENDQEVVADDDRTTKK